MAAGRDPTVRAQQILAASEDAEKPTPELALFMALMEERGQQVLYNDFVWLNNFPFRDRMTVEDWEELWREVNPVVQKFWQRFHA